MSLYTSLAGPAPSRFLPTMVTVATLYSTYPPANYPQMYVWVTDLHDGYPDYVISDGTYWKPVRPLVVRNIANGDQAMTLTALTNAPTQVVGGTLTAARTLTFSLTNAYPGAKFRVKRTAGGLFNLLTGGIGLSLNSWTDFEFDPAGAWVQTASGGLL